MNRPHQWLQALAGVLLVALATSSLAVAADIPQGPLVSTAWLQANLTHPKLRLIEVSVNPGVYERGHIPGAVNFSWHHDLNDRVQRDIVSRENFEKLLSQVGVGPDSTVILYGDTNNWFAAWGAWVFDIYGVPNVKLLDGGHKKWEAENLPLDPAWPPGCGVACQTHLQRGAQSPRGLLQRCEPCSRNAGHIGSVACWWG